MTPVGLRPRGSARAALLMLLVGISLFLLADAHPAAAASPLTPGFAYTVSRPNACCFELWLARLDGKGAHQVDLGDTSATDVSISPNGQQVVYINESQEVRIVNIDGTGSRLVLAKPSAMEWWVHPRWSPDGTHLAMTRDSITPYGREFTIWQVATDGSGLKKLIDWPAPNPPTYGPDQRDPAYSPDGSKIVFASTVSPTGQAIPAGGIGGSGYSLWIANVDGSNPRQVTPTPPSPAPNQMSSPNAEAAAFSPDGQKLVYTHTETDPHTQTRSEQQDLRTVNVDGTSDTRVTSTADEEEFPSWSSDGQRIIYMRLDGEGGLASVITSKPDGTDVKAAVDFGPTGPGPGAVDVQGGMVADTFQPWVDPTNASQWTATNPTAAIDLSVHDDISGVQQVDVTAPDDATWDSALHVTPTDCSSTGNTCPADQVVSFRAGNLSAGYHSIRVTVTDSAGNSWTRPFTLGVGAETVSADDSHASMDDGVDSGSLAAIASASTGDYCHTDGTIQNQVCTPVASNTPYQQAMAETALSGNPQAPLAGSSPYPFSFGAKRLRGNQYGFSDQLGLAFTSQSFTDLNIKRVRIIVPYDVAEHGANPAGGDFVPTSSFQNTKRRYDQMKTWFKNVQLAGYSDILVSFEKSADSPTTVPTVAHYEESVTRFRSWLRQKGYSVPFYAAWNEANLPKAEPTGASGTSVTGATMAAHYYNVVLKMCNDSTSSDHCAVLAGDFSDKKPFLPTKWVAEYMKVVGPNPKLWGWHPYADANASQSTRFASFLKGIRPGSVVWFTEGNGIVKNSYFTSTVVAAEQHLRYLLNTMISFPQTQPAPVSGMRVTRFYAYSWSPGSPWDSGITDINGGRRPAYCTLQGVTNPSMGASCQSNSTG